MSLENGENNPQNGVSVSFLEKLGFKRKNTKKPVETIRKEEKSVEDQPKLPILEILSSFITLFLSVSTIHGFAHVIAEKRHPVEILIWLSLMGTGIYGACVLSSATWTRYQENPTVVSMERDRFAWNTSFPAATICPSYKVNEELLNNFLAKTEAKNKTALRHFLISLAEAGYKTFDQVLPYFEIPSEQFMGILLQLQYDFSPSVSNSGIHGYKYFLEKTVTEMGICYTFNSNLAVYNSPTFWESNSWSLLPENKTFYVHPLDGEVFANVVNMSTGFDALQTFDQVLPYFEIPSEQFMNILLQLQYEFSPSVSNSGVHGYKYFLEKTITEMGICYTFNSNLAVYKSPTYWESNSWSLLPENKPFYVHPLDGEVFANVVNMSTGFDIYLHGPNEVVDVASKGVYSPNGHFLQVYLSGLTIFTTDSARALAASQRKCRFYDESDLRHSPVYSYVLCRMECRASLARKLCGCIPHFYRHLDGERVCDVNGMHCLSKYKERLITMKKECSCYPNCNDVNYVIEDLDTREWFLGSNLQWGLKEYPRMRLRRDVIFGFTDVLVYVGGMAGLFLGCSVLSFIEIFYFFTIRLFWYVTKYGTNTREIYNAVQ